MSEWDLFSGCHGWNSLSLFLCASRLPRSLAPAGVRPPACNGAIHPKRSQAVPIGRVLAGCSCTSGAVELGCTEEPSSFPGLPLVGGFS